jgi:hypothetical protein
MLIDEPIRPVVGDMDRRCISDDYFDLFVWYQPDGQIHGFQLCYDKHRRERALTWTRDRGFLHAGIDTGEGSPNANRTPILVDGGDFPAHEVRGQFVARSVLLSDEIRDLVLVRLDEYENRRRA